MKKYAGFLVLLLYLLFSSSALAAQEVQFNRRSMIGFLGQNVSVSVRCLDPGQYTPGDTFELRTEDGRLLCEKAWKNLKQALTFSFTVKAALPVSTRLSVWHDGEVVSSDVCSALFRDANRSAIRQLRPSRSAISLTIVCGGGSHQQMDDILAVLDKYGVKATFFINGGYLNAMPDDARKIVEHGHELASHGMLHIDMTQLDNPNEIRLNITRMNEICERMLGVRPTLFRAPFSYTNEKVTAIVRSEGMEDILWTVDSLDWDAAASRGKPREIISRICHSNIRSGSIIQFHLNGFHTAEVLDAIIPRYHREFKLELVTVSELLALSGR